MSNYVNPIKRSTINSRIDSQLSRSFEASSLFSPITVTILTKNEEHFIERCIKSVSWAGEVLVLDSGSTDRTKEIAASLGAVVYEHEWLGWTVQHQKATHLAKYDWILTLDADEIVTPELARSIQAIMRSNPDPQNGYSVDRRGDFLGILLPNSSRPEKKRNFIRLFNRHFGAYDPTLKVHEEVRVPGVSILLPGALLHWRGSVMDEYILSANRYCSLESAVLDEQGKQANAWMIFLRPILRFIWCYILHGEFRLGTRGLIHSMLAATREYIRYAKLWEMQNTKRVLSPPDHIYSEPRAEDK